MPRIRFRPAALLVPFLLPIVLEAQSPPSQPAITVTAHASRRIAADRANIAIAVETRASTSAEAGSMNATIQRAVISALRAAGITERQLTTSGYSVGEDLRRDPREKVAPGTRFLATNSIRVEISDLDQIGRFIDAALGAGATSISSVTFSAHDAEETRREVLAVAMASARSDAAVMATAAGRSLGPLLEATTADPGSPAYSTNSAYIRISGVSAQGEPTPITPREVEVVATVFTKWQLDPAKP